MTPVVTAPPLDYPARHEEFLDRTPSSDRGTIIATPIRSRAGGLLLAALAVVLVAGSAYAHRRWISTNFHEVVPGSVYRSAQPSSERLDGWIRDLDLATVLNLNDDGDFADEAAVAQDAGVRYMHMPLSDLGLPHRNTFLALLDSLETLPQPMLVHCRAGADRAGMVSVLALMAVGGLSFDESRSQLSYRYLHVGSNRAAVEGAVMLYEEHCARGGLGPGGWIEFRAWARDHYSHSYLLVEVAAPDTIRTAAGVLDSVEVVIHNRSDTAIPAGDPERGFRLATYRGSAVGMEPDHEYFPRLVVDHTIAARDSLRVTKRFHSPAEPGAYEMRFDMLEAGVTWFCSAGSPERARVLLVGRTP